jgi:oligopeptide/dipeptide ABC transporter ATP-binding protein
MSDLARAVPPPGPAAGTPVPGAQSGGAHDVTLEVAHLSVDYISGREPLHAVDDVSLTLRRGEMLGLAGESGSGKSTLAYAITRLLRPPGQVTGGQVRYHPRSGAPVDVLGMSADELRRFRWAELSIVFQSAMNALNPVIPVRAQIDDVLRTHTPGLSRSDRAERIAALLGMVGIPADRSKAYPHELSGGMRQRVTIALALALEPEIIVMDEPTTALDVVIQRQILAEVRRLRTQLGFAVIFITHDLSLLIEMADTIAIMYAGRLSELAPAGELYQAPRHPYSRGLLDSFPALHGPQRRSEGIPGSPPDLRAVPTGCAFHPRCGWAFERCTQMVPPLTSRPLEGDSGDRRVACHLYGEGGSNPATLVVQPDQLDNAGRSDG